MVEQAIKAQEKQVHSLREKLDKAEKYIQGLRLVLDGVKNGDLELEAALDAFNGQKQHVEERDKPLLPTKGSYNPNTSWAKKFCQVLELEGEFMQLVDVAETAAKHEGITMREAADQMSKRTGTLQKRNKIVKYKIEGEHSYWGLPSWVDSEGNPIESRLPYEVRLNSI